MIKLLCWLKVNWLKVSIENLVSQPQIDMEISHEEFSMILKEKGKYENMKENLKHKRETRKYEIK